MLVIGLTGGIGSGKSSVSALLAQRGAEIIDADAIVHEIQQPDGRAYQGIVDRFGPEILRDDGTLDRPALAKIVFDDAEARKDLERLTFPHVGAVIAERMTALAESDSVVVLDIPLMAEGGKGRYNSAGTLVVDCPPELAVERVVEQRGMDADDARRRQAAQAPREKRLEMADFVIDNSGDRAHLEAEVTRAWTWIQNLRQ
jgi:dephospho-CoA kinase